jgi:hypothetical protein
MTDAPPGRGSESAALQKCKAILTSVSPIDGELLPALLVEWRGGRKRASAQNQDIRLKDAEYFGGRTFIRRIKRQDFDAGDLLGHLPEQRLPPRNRKHTSASCCSVWRRVRPTDAPCIYATKTKTIARKSGRM